MRRGLALVVVALIAIGAVGGAESATPAKRYLRLAAAGEFSYMIDYGSHPNSVYNGTFEWTFAYTINAIAVYDGRAVSVSSSSMVAEGFVLVDERRTLWGRTGRVKVRCKNELKETNDRKAVFSAGGVSVSSGGLSVDPGPALNWNTGCSATESLPNHGLPGGPGFTVPAPPKSRFTGTKYFSFGCKDSYSHDYDRPGQSSGHSFTGSINVWVKFTPFPESKLTETKRALRDKVGKRLPGGYTTLSSKPLKNCP